MLADDKGISIVEAMKILYTSPFYKRLADESTKLWHLGPVALYEEYQESLWLQFCYFCGLTASIDW